MNRLTIVLHQILQNGFQRRGRFLFLHYFNQHGGLCFWLDATSKSEVSVLAIATFFTCLAAWTSNEMGGTRLKRAKRGTFVRKGAVALFHGIERWDPINESVVLFKSDESRLAMRDKCCYEGLALLSVVPL